MAADRIVAVAVATALVLGASLYARLESVSAAVPAQFRWFVPAPAPRSWSHSRLPAGGAILSYPRSLVRIGTGKDTGSVSAAKTDRAGRIHVYLNATPKQGNESLRDWPDFRIHHNSVESLAVHEEARAFGLPFLGGKGSCVIDRYTSRVKNNHYREIACFVQGRSTSSVVVAAALRSEWARAAALLERAVSAYRVA